MKFHEIWLTVKDFDLKIDRISRLYEKKISDYISQSTEDGSTNVVLQILYCPYLILGVRIWELYVLDLKTKVFCRKENQLHFSIDKGLTEPK